MILYETESLKRRSWNFKDTCYMSFKNRRDEVQKRVSIM